VLGRFLATFAVIFLAELPDKTVVATLVLTSTYRRPFYVWVGAAAGFLIQVVIAVLAGGLLARLPEVPVKLAVATIFAIGGIVLWRQRNKPAESGELHLSSTHSPLRVASVAFTTLVVAEVGDITQLTIASLAASSGQPVPVFLGGLLALWTVAALATAGGMALLKRVPIALVRAGAAVVFGILAIVTLIEVLA
jgi:putative Ca2+/H+ antiporter (TMEM165/GDT1 family)